MCAFPGPRRLGAGIGACSSLIGPAVASPESSAHQPASRPRGLNGPRAHGLIVFFIVVLLATPAGAQLYDFNAGSSTDGWTLAGAYVDANNPCTTLTPVTDNLTGMYWLDATNYPTATIGSDPVDSAGAIRFDTSALGDGIATPGSYWYVHLVSPDLVGRVGLAAHLQGAGAPDLQHGSGHQLGQPGRQGLRPRLASGPVFLQQRHAGHHQRGLEHTDVRLVRAGSAFRPATRSRTST